MFQRELASTIASLFFGLASSASAQTNQASFEPFQAYPVGSWPQSVAIGDFDSDGRNDVALTTSFYFDPQHDFSLFVFRQQFDGSLPNTPLVLRTHGAYSDSMGVVAGDWNGDGADDLAVCTSAGVDLFVQRNGRLRGPLLVPLALGAHDAVAVEITGDGRQDLVVRGPGGVHVLSNTGHGFLLSTVTTGGQGEVEVGELTGDGLLDIVGFTGKSIHVYAQQGGGTWASAATYVCTVGYWPIASGISVGDVTGDGRADVVATIGGNQPGAMLNVFEQLSNGVLASPVVYPSYDIPEPSVVADVNGDGRQDVIDLHGGWLRAGIYYQDLGGALMPESLHAIPYASHYNLKGLAVGDVSGDGLADIVIADSSAGLVVLRQAP